MVDESGLGGLEPLARKELLQDEGDPILRLDLLPVAVIGRKIDGAIRERRAFKR